MGEAEKMGGIGIFFIIGHWEMYSNCRHRTKEDSVNGSSALCMEQANLRCLRRLKNFLVTETHLTVATS